MNQKYFLFMVFIYALTGPLSFAFVPKSFSSRYEEKVKSLSGKEKTSQGKLDYLYPGYLRFEVEKPHPSLFIVNPQKTWLYQPAFIEGEEDQVTIQKTSDLPLLKFFDSMSEGLKKSSLMEPSYEGKDLHLLFTAKGVEEFGLQKIILHTDVQEAIKMKSLKEVKELTLIYPNKKSVHLKLLDFKDRTDLSPKNFEFHPSSKMKVINQ